MRLWKRPFPYQYTMTDSSGLPVVLEVVNHEKDLGVTVDNQLSFKTHIAEVTNAASKKVGMIRRGFRYLDGQIFNMLFKSLVRPGLEYCHSVWRPHLVTEMRKVEQVQRRATKLVPEVKNLPYSDRLKALNLPSMEYRLRRGDMIEVWKVLNEAYNGEFQWLKMNADTNTRSNGAKLVYDGKSNPQKCRAFSQRVQRDWRSLPPSVVNARTLNSFKTALDNHWDHLKFIHPGPYSVSNSADPLVTLIRVSACMASPVTTMVNE